MKTVEKFEPVYYGRDEMGVLKPTGNWHVDLKIVLDNLVDAVKELQEKVEELELKDSIENEEWISVKDKLEEISPKDIDTKKVVEIAKSMGKPKEHTYTVKELDDRWSAYAARELDARYDYKSARLFEEFIRSLEEHES